MKLIEIVNARGSLQKLVGQELPLRVAYRLVKVTDAINFHLTVYGGELMKLGENPDPDIPQMTGEPSLCHSIRAPSVLHASSAHFTRAGIRLMLASS